MLVILIFVGLRALMEVQGDRNQSHFEWQGKAKNFMSFNMFDVVLA